MKKYISRALPAYLLIVFSFFVTEQAFSQSSTVPTGITAGRARALAGGALGLISLIIGWRAKARSGRGTVSRRSAPIAAVLLGAACIILSIVHLVTTTGGFGTGGGKAGAVVSLVLGLIGITLGGWALRKRNKLET
jgi:hypothetical protein